MSRADAVTLVTFDLDNTLWSVRKVIGNAEARMREHLAAALPDFNDHFTRDTLWRTREALLPVYPHIRHDLTAMRERVLEHALTEFGIAQSTAATLARSATQAFLDGRHEVEFFPHALDTLAKLSQRYTLAALSNGNADIGRLGLDRYFSFSCSAADAGASKPAPAMFQQALQRAGVAATAAAHVGDHPVDDIQGARDVGMHTVLVELDGVEPHPGTIGQEADASARVTCLSELPAVLDALR